MSVTLNLKRLFITALIIAVAVLSLILTLGSESPAPIASASLLHVVELETDVEVSPSIGSPGSIVDVTLTVYGDSSYSVQDTELNARVTGSLELLPGTFSPTPSLSGLTDLTWIIDPIDKDSVHYFRGKAQITGAGTFAIEMTGAGRVLRSVNIDSADIQGAGEGAGATSSIQDSQDPVMVDDTYEYIIRVSGQGTYQQNPLIYLWLPEQVDYLDSTGSTCDLDGPKLRCQGDTLGSGDETTIKVTVQATDPGANPHYVVKARLVVSYPEMEGVETVSEELTWIYPKQESAN